MARRARGLWPAQPKTVTTDATDLKAHCTALSLPTEKGSRPPDRPQRREAWTRSSMPPPMRTGALSFFMIAGQVGEGTGAVVLLNDLPEVRWLLGDRGQDADRLRDTP